MKIQSAGRLGNILFIWAYAKWIQETYKIRNVTIFADKYHTELNAELRETFRTLNDDKVHFEINNFWGFTLKVIDKLAIIHVGFSDKLQKILKIHSEGRDDLSKDSRILRGYFQKSPIFSETNHEVANTLNQLLKQKAQEVDLVNKFPFLNKPYQAMHIRLTDYKGSKFGVIDPNSQLSCLDKKLQIVVCTDGSHEDIAQRIDVRGIEVLTPKNTTAWETICILSGAENLVTTNSTLSWWSGFVAAANGKKVWIPEYWNPLHESITQFQSHNSATYTPVFE